MVGGGVTLLLALLAQDSFEIAADALQKGDRVIIVDDLLATGGSLKAAAQLVTDSLATPLACLVIVELSELKVRCCCCCCCYCNHLDSHWLLLPLL